MSWAPAAVTIAVTGNINAGVKGSYSIQGCWSTSAAGAGSATVCQAVIQPPAIIGGGGFGAYSVVTGTSGASFATTPTYNYPMFHFILSSITSANAIDIAVINNVVPAVAAVATGTTTTPTLQNATAGTTGNAPGAPTFVTRSGAVDSAGNSFLLIGKGSASIAWGAVRVRRPIGSGANSWGWNASNTASAIGQLTWVLGPFSYSSAAITTAGTAWQCDTGYLGGVANGGYGATFPLPLTVAGTLTATGVKITTAATGCSAFPTVSLVPATAGTFTDLTVLITTGANNATPVTGAAGTTAVYTVNNFITFPTGASPGWACGTSPAFKVASITGNFPATVDLTNATAGVCTAVKFNSNGGLDITGWCSAAAAGNACDANTTLTAG